MSTTTLILTRTHRIDWPRVIANIERTGMSVQEIAVQVDVSKAALYSYLQPDTSTEPAHWVGSALLALWALRTGYSWTAAPTRKVTPSVGEVLRGG